MGRPISIRLERARHNFRAVSNEANATSYLAASEIALWLKR
jgi:hypothetical protein